LLVSLVGLLQNRFFFSASVFKFDASAIFDFSKNVRDAVGRSLAGVVSLSLGLLWGVFAFALISSQLKLFDGSLFNGAVSGASQASADADWVWSSFQQAGATQLLLAGVFYTLLVGGMARVIVGWRFREQNGMTREELAAEAREMEGDPLFRPRRQEPN